MQEKYKAYHKQGNYRNRKKCQTWGGLLICEVADCASNWFRMNLGQTETDGGQELRHPYGALNPTQYR